MIVLTVILAGARRDMHNKLLKALLGTNFLNIWGLGTLTLLVIALEENYRTSRSKAIMIALLPSVIYLVFNYFAI